MILYAQIIGAIWGKSAVYSILTSKKYWIGNLKMMKSVKKYDFFHEKVCEQLSRVFEP